MITLLGSSIKDGSCWGETDRDPVPALSGLQKEVGHNDPVLTPAQGGGDHSCGMYSLS